MVIDFEVTGVKIVSKRVESLLVIGVSVAPKLVAKTRVLLNLAGHAVIELLRSR